MKVNTEKKEKLTDRLHLAVTGVFKDRMKRVADKKYLNGELDKPDVSIVARVWLEEKLQEFEQAA